MDNNVVSILQHITILHRHLHDHVHVIGDEVFVYDTVNGNRWFKIDKVGDDFIVSMVGYEKGKLVQIGADVEDLMAYLKTPFGTEHCAIKGIIEIGQFIDRLIASRGEAYQQHHAYFTMLGEVGERYKRAVDAMRAVMVDVGRRYAAMDSVSYFQAVRELDESGAAFRALVTSVANVEFNKEVEPTKE